MLQYITLTSSLPFHSCASPVYRIDCPLRPWCMCECGRKAELLALEQEATNFRVRYETTSPTPSNALFGNLGSPILFFDVVPHLPFRETQVGRYPSQYIDYSKHTVGKSCLISSFKNDLTHAWRQRAQHKQAWPGPSATVRR